MRWFSHTQRLSRHNASQEDLHDGGLDDDEDLDDEVEGTVEGAKLRRATPHPPREDRDTLFSYEEVDPGEVDSPFGLQQCSLYFYGRSHGDGADEASAPSPNRTQVWDSYAYGCVG